MRTLGTGSKDTRSRGGHDRVHDEQACDKAEKAKKTTAGAAEIRGQEEEKKLRWSFGSKAVNYTDEKHGAFVVAKFKWLWTRKLAIAKTLEVPLRLLRSRDEQGDTAGR